jgi:hypothetical protein
MGRKSTFLLYEESIWERKAHPSYEGDHAWEEEPNLLIALILRKEHILAIKRACWGRRETSWI